MKKRFNLLLLIVINLAFVARVHAGNVLQDILKAYQTYQEVNMTLWLVGDVGAEKRFGKELQFWLGLSTKPEKDPKINAYVKGIFNRLVPHFKNHGLNYDVRVIKNNTANAFAIPGGHIYVHTGLLDLAKTDDELATVLAHELAHAERRHSLQNFRASTAAVALLNAAVKNRKDRETWGALLGYLTLMKFSRKQEDEADDIGQFRMASAGFNPAAQVTVWEKFLKKYGDSKGVEQYLSSHPPSSKRIENARNNLTRMNVSEKTVFANTRNLMSAEKANLLGNPSFELPQAANGAISGWQISEGRARISQRYSAGGRNSLELLSEERLSKTRVLSEFVPVNQSSDLTLSGWLISESGAQNAAVGIELYDAQKRLRNRIWAIKKSDKVPEQGARFETRLVNTAKQPLFAANTAFMRIVLQAGLVSKGSVWFDDFRLKPTSAADPVNLLAAGDFERSLRNGFPEGVVSSNQKLELDFSKAKTGYASLKIPGVEGSTGFAFSPMSTQLFKPGQNVDGSFFFTADRQIKGIVVVELLDSSGRALERRLAQVEFEADKNHWTGTSFSFSFDLKNEETGKVSAIQIRLASEVPPGANLWVDNFVMR